MPIVFNDVGQKIFFFHIPKAGGSSVEDILMEHYQCALMPDRVSGSSMKINRVSQQHIHYSIYSDMGFDSICDGSFSVVRNPFERIKSEYKYQCRKKIFRSCFNLNTFVVYSILRAKLDPSVFDNHIRAQIDFVGEDTKVFKLENGMDKVVSFLRNNYGLINIKDSIHVNKSKPREEVFDKVSYSMISKYYRSDFGYFGYDVDYSYRNRSAIFSYLGATKSMSLYLLFSSLDKIATKIKNILGLK